MEFCERRNKKEKGGKPHILLHPSLGSQSSLDNCSKISHHHLYHKKRNQFILKNKVFNKKKRNQSIEIFPFLREMIQREGNKRCDRISPLRLALKS